MLRVMAIDPGLAACGVVVGETDGQRHRLLSSSLWVTEEHAERSSLVGDSRVMRARELRDMAASQLRTWTPNVVAIEEFGFLQMQHATACLAMAMMALICEIDRAHVPVIGVLARDWRDVLAALRGKVQRVKTKRMKRGEAKAMSRDAQQANRARTIEREKRAHVEAMKRVEQSVQLERFNKTQAPHVKDALGIFCWAVDHPFVRAMHFTARHECVVTFEATS